MKGLKLLLVVMVGLVLLALLGACAKPAAPPTGEKVKLVHVHLTGLTGPMGASLTPHAVMMELVADHLNGENFIPGAELVVRTYDTGLDPVRAVTAFKRAMAETPRPVSCHIQISCDGLACKALIKREKIPNIAGNANPLLSTRGSWIFSSEPRAEGLLEAGADYFINEVFKESRAPRFAYCVIDYAWGRGHISDASIRYIKSIGFDYMGAVYIPMAAADTTPQMLQLKEWDVDAVGGAYFQEQFVVVRKDAHRVGLDTTWLASGSTIGADMMIESLGPLAEGGLYFIHYLRPDEWEPWMHEIFEGAGFRPADTVTGSSATGECMVAFEAIRRAAEKVGPANVTGQDVYDAVKTIKGWKGYFASPLDFSEDLVGVSYVRAQQVVHGEVVVVAEDLYVPDTWAGGADYIAD